MGLSYEEAKRQPYLKAGEESALLIAYRERTDQAAAEKLVSSYARLAYSIAYKYTKDDDRAADLAAEGMIGILRAAKKYDPTKGKKFSSYSRLWVGMMISEAALDTLGTVSMPKRSYIRTKSGRNLEDADAMAAVFGSVSTSDYVHEGVERGDTLVSDSDSPEDDVSKNQAKALLQGFIDEAMPSLDEREADIIRRRYFTEPQQTSEAIGRCYGISRQRVSQIEAKALDKLRKHAVRSGRDRLLLSLLSG